VNIAYLGWGSLIWKAGALKTAGSWEKDGPLLPIEFARISDDKSLYPGVHDVQTLWVRAVPKDVENAVHDLGKRERTSKENMGVVCIPAGTKRCNVIPDAWPLIETWAKQKELDAVVWTDLSSNFKKKTGMEFSHDNAVEYLLSLSGEPLIKAENYVRRAPEQIETDLRKRLKEELGWRSLEEYRNGFWLDKNTYIKADEAQIQVVGRRKPGDTYGRSENAQMLILTDAVEMIVDDKGKILGLDKHPKFGLWLETVNKAIRNQTITAAQSPY
jgi:hypothetical protein